jgi:SAM-dependent methyltransferase
MAVSTESRKSRRKKSITPEPVFRIGAAYWSSGLLFAAFRLGLFDVLDEKPRSVDELSRKLKITKPWAAKLVGAGEALGLVVAGDSGFANADVAARHLVKGKPGYLGDLLTYFADLWPRFGELDHVIRHGEIGPRETAMGLMRTDAERLASERAWVLAMDNIAASGQAEALCGVLDLTGSTRLLDVSGGPGSYARALVQKTPGLTAEILDLPEVAAIASEFIRRDGLADRVTVRGGDFLNDSYGDDNDAVLLSGVLHGFTEKHVNRLLRKSFRSLRPGGRLIVQEMTTDAPAHSAALFASLFSLNMMSGAAYSAETIALWLNAAGFTEISVRSLENACWFDHVITGRKP